MTLFWFNVITSTILLLPDISRYRRQKRLNIGLKSPTPSCLETPGGATRVYSRVSVLQTEILRVDVLRYALQTQKQHLTLNPNHNQQVC